ncbi:MAG: sigma-70 family RNA polymerase sigma factor [Planctomycetota bacterium]|nr:sigma-70 family RNA polymerase sigma factor [Planctomycetota bacterium]
MGERPTKAIGDLVPRAEIARLWQQHSSGLLLLVRARFGGQVDCEAEDILQDAFTRLARQTQMPDDVLAWLVRTSRNLAIDAFRSRKRRKQSEGAVASERRDWFEERQSSTIFASEIEVAIAELPIEEREIMVAHLWNGMSFRQIAAAFETSSSAANRRYQSALQHLRSRLGPGEPQKRQATVRRS